jgi:hypothetical protein
MVDEYTTLKNTPEYMKRSICLCMITRTNAFVSLYRENAPRRRVSLYNRLKLVFTLVNYSAVLSPRIIPVWYKILQ